MPKHSSSTLEKEEKLMSARGRLEASPGLNFYSFPFFPFSFWWLVGKKKGKVRRKNRKEPAPPSLQLSARYFFTTFLSMEILKKDEGRRERAC
jgi:hypothetical protein